MYLKNNTSYDTITNLKEAFDCAEAQGLEKLELSKIYLEALTAIVINPEDNIEGLMEAHDFMLKQAVDYEGELDLSPSTLTEIWERNFLEIGDYVVVSALMPVSKDAEEYEYLVLVKFENQYSSHWGPAVRSTFCTIEGAQKWVHWVSGPTRELSLTKYGRSMSEAELAEKISGFKCARDMQKFARQVYGLYADLSIRETQSTEYASCSMMVDLVHKHGVKEIDSIIENLGDWVDETNDMPIEFW